jgi:hypothetical protein
MIGFNGLKLYQKQEHMLQNGQVVCIESQAVHLYGETLPGVRSAKSCYDPSTGNCYKIIVNFFDPQSKI